MAEGWDLSHRQSIEQKYQDELWQSREAWDSRRLAIAQALESRAYELVMGVVIFFNAGLIMHETDARAAGEAHPAWWQVVDVIFFIVYVMDIMVRLFAHRWSFFISKWNLLDLLVVVSDVTAQALMSLIGNIPSFAALRVCRIFRLTRFMHLLFLFRELHIMLTGFVSAMRAIFWASLMLFLMLTLWSIIAVEVLHPITQRLAKQGTWPDCERCGRAFSSIWQANLTFVQQIIADDNWGEVTIPIIEASPLSALILLTTMITLKFGVLNLVLTVIVDVAQTSHEQDAQRKIAEKSMLFENAKKELLMLCTQLDVDNSGELSMEELLAGVDSNAKFAETMCLLDITRDDLHIVFTMMDEDCSGQISYREFVEQLHRMKTQDTHTSLVFIKGYVNDVRHKMAEQIDILRTEVCGRLQSLKQQVDHLVCGDEARTLAVSIESAGVLKHADSLENRDACCTCVFPDKVSSRQATHDADATAPLVQYEANQSPSEKPSISLSTIERNLDRLTRRIDDEHARLMQSSATKVDDLSRCIEGGLEKLLQQTVAKIDEQTAILRDRTSELQEKKKQVPAAVWAPGAPFSLIKIEEDIKKLSRQIDGDLGQLMRDAISKMNQQMVLLQDWQRPPRPLAPGGWNGADFTDVSCGDEQHRVGTNLGTLASRQSIGLSTL